MRCRDLSGPWGLVSAPSLTPRVLESQNVRSRRGLGSQLVQTLLSQRGKLRTKESEVDPGRGTRSSDFQAGVLPASLQ